MGPACLNLWPIPVVKSNMGGMQAVSSRDTGPAIKGGDEISWVEKARGGDAPAFEKLYRKHCFVVAQGMQWFASGLYETGMFHPSPQGGVHDGS